VSRPSLARARRLLAGAALCATLPVAAPTASMAQAPARAPAPAAPAGVVAETLPNGLRVLLLEDHRLPVATVQVWYRVGSRNERPGGTGLAHFLEHMMFKGTRQYGPGSFSRLVEEAGGHDNAYTNQDETVYHVEIAAGSVDLVLRLEADRMRNLRLDAPAIESERQVVMEERRTRTEDDPEGYLSEELSSLAFRAHPYGWPVIGWMEDIGRIRPAELRAFYDTYYQPNNAMLVIAGDVARARVLPRVRELFGAIPRGPAPPPVTAVEPPPTGERRVTVRKAGAQLPLVAIAYHVPSAAGSKDAAALELLSVILSEGRASRLYRRLVYEERIALSAAGEYSYHSRDPNLFWFSATVMPGHGPEEVERALLAEVERLQAEAVPDEELTRAKNQIEASYVWQQDSVRARASSLARFELLGSWRLAEGFVPAIHAVSAEDLQRVARTYFGADGRAVGRLLPVVPAPAKP
jgi:zinc protease